MNRLVTSQVDDVAAELLFKRLTGYERLSELFELEVDLLSESNRINLKELLGKSLTLTIRASATTPRYLNGQIIRITLVGRETSGNRYYIYKAIVKPHLWNLTQNKDSRIFQNKKVPDIIENILNDFSIAYENKLSYDYREWEYCVQYQESSFNFINRLMEHEGIYYYFKHENGKHTLVFTDSNVMQEKLPGYEIVPYRPDDAGLIAHEEHINQWMISDAITPSYYSLDDYDFRKPRATLFQARQNPASFAALDSDDSSGRAEVFEWPGGFINHDHGEFYARVRQQEMEARHELITGGGPLMSLAPGYQFMLVSAPRIEDNGNYLTVSCNYFVEEGGYSSGSSSESEHYCSFEVIPANIEWRPARHTAWPKTHGPQTAEVSGPAGEKIWTDKYGRVKVKFRWDRYGMKNETSSCWVRVSSAWAGWKYGQIQVPRIGEEVVIDFINGEPDRPIIVGRVYNEDSMPPWGLPGNANVMGFMSRSRNGHASNANYLLFDDSDGVERFDMHAEYDMNTHVENNQKTTIDVNREITVHGTLDETIDGDVTHTYNAKRDITVKGLENEVFETGQVVTINSGGRNFTIDAGDDIVEISSDQSFTLHGSQTVQIDSDQGITITGNKSETVTGKHTFTITGQQEIDVTADVTNTYHSKLTTAVTGDVALTSDTRIDMEATASEIKLTAPTITMDTQNFVKTTKTSGWNYIQELFGNYGCKLNATASSLSFTGASLSATGFSGSITAFSWNHTGVQYSRKPVKYSDVLNDIKNGGFNLESFLITFIM